MHKPSEDYPDQRSTIEGRRLQSQISELRNQISDLGTAVDAFKAKKGGALGGGVFFMLLALVAGYDLFNGKSNLWSAVGIPEGMLKFLAVGLAGAALALFSLAAVLEKRRDRSREAKLAALEEELEALLARQSAQGPS